MNAKEMADNAKTTTILVGEPVWVTPQKDCQMATSDVYLFEADEFRQFCEQLCREQKDIDKQAIWSRVDMEVGYIHKHNALTAIENAPILEL